MMLWKILNKKNREIAYFVDGDRIFSVADVIRPESTKLNYDFDDDEENELLYTMRTTNDSRRSSIVYRRMID